MTAPSLDDLQREREYTPSSCIGGNYQPYIDAYVQRSRQAREQAQVLGGRWLDLRYGPAMPQHTALCVPAAAKSTSPCPLLVFFHGGYWQELSAADSLFAAAACIQQGCAFAAVNYSLAPAVGVSDIVDECRCALAQLQGQAGTLGLDSTRVVVAGSSAGAHLAAMVCLPAPGAAAAVWRPSAAVLVSGIYALGPLVGTSINTALGLTPTSARSLSPALLPLQGFPRAHVCWGAIETEAFKQQSQRFAQKLARAGTLCSTAEVPQRNHFDVILDLADENTPLGQHTFELLRTRPPSAPAPTKA